MKTIDRIMLHPVTFQMIVYAGVLTIMGLAVSHDFDTQSKCEARGGNIVHKGECYKLVPVEKKK